MNRWYFLIFVATISALVSGRIAQLQNSQGGSYQQPYQPVVPCTRLPVRTAAGMAVATVAGLPSPARP